MFWPLKRMLRNSDATAELLGKAVAGIANQTDLLNRKLEEVIVGIANQTDLLNRKLDVLVEAIGQLRLEAPQRLEVALVRELEIACSSGTAPAVVGRASPYQWCNACHNLWE